MSFFKKIKELFDKPEHQSASGEWFYHTKTFSRKIIIFYKKIIEQKKQNNILKTGETIAIPQLLFNENTTSVIKKWGNPRCSFKTIKDNHIVHIFFYRRDYVYENTLIQLQFFDNQLFFIGVEVGKNLMQQETKMNMLQKFLPNFVSDKLTDVAQIPIYCDTENNFLLVEDDVSLNICYLSGAFTNDNIFILEDTLAATKH